MSDTTQHCPSCESLAKELATTKQKLDEVNIDNRRLAEYAKEIDEARVAAQLHIKELREFVDATKVWFSTETMIGKGLHDKAEALLAKQPDTRALDKALLEARIDELNKSLSGEESSMMDRVIELEAKLAELNKEV